MLVRVCGCFGGGFCDVDGYDWVVFLQVFEVVVYVFFLVEDVDDQVVEV